jgi:hypothetical protein
MGDDSTCGDLVTTATGEVIWGAISDESTLYYRIEGWDNWERYAGKITLKQASPAPLATGTGLTCEYFDNLNFAGKPALTRLDPDIWFGPVWGDSREIKARRGWFTNNENPSFNPGSCTSRWTGFIEAPFTEDFLFVVYLYGQRPGPNELFGSRVRLWIDGKKIIDEWDRVKFQKPDGMRTRDCHSIKIPMRAGKLVPLKLEYAGVGGAEAHLHLYWQSPSLDMRHIPQKYFYPKTADK